MAPYQLILDPGLGFGKRAEQSSQLLGRLCDLREMLPRPFARTPLLVGASRKRFLSAPEQHPHDRDVASAAAAALSVYQGATFVRAHNVPMTVEAVRIAHDCLVNR